MVRTIISLDDDDREWLERKAASEGVPMTKLVREAIRLMRQQRDASFERLFDQTSGLGRKGDGLAHQRRLRREWR